MGWTSLRVENRAPHSRKEWGGEWRMRSCIPLQGGGMRVEGESHLNLLKVFQAHVEESF